MTDTQTQEQIDAEDKQMATQQRFLMLRALHNSPKEFREAVQLARLAVNTMVNGQGSLEEYTAAITGISLATLDLQIEPKSEKDFPVIQLINT